MKVFPGFRAFLLTKAEESLDDDDARKEREKNLEGTYFAYECRRWEI